jgi:hypothetical protein
MKSSSTKKTPPDSTAITNRPRQPKPVSPDAVWLTSNQVCARYGGRSLMWLWRKVKTDPNFPRPHYSGRFQFYSLVELNAYDAAFLLQKTA